MGVYVKHHLGQMKTTRSVKLAEINSLEQSLETKRSQVEDLDRGIRALEALGDD